MRENIVVACEEDVDYIKELIEALSGQLVAEVGRSTGTSAGAQRRSCAFDLER